MFSYQLFVACSYLTDHTWFVSKLQTLCKREKKQREELPAGRSPGGKFALLLRMFLIAVSTCHQVQKNFWPYWLVVCRSQWPRGLRRRSASARLLRLWVRIPPGAWMSVVSIVCCQVEVSATSWSLVRMSPTDCGASCVIQKPREWGGPAPLGAVAPKTKQKNWFVVYRKWGADFHCGL